MSNNYSERARFSEKLFGTRARLIDLCSSLVRIPSENPPGDTSAIAVAVSDFLLEIPGLSCERIEPKQGITNIVAHLPFSLPGRRLVINAHLDTFPVGDSSKWSIPPLGGVRKHGRIYGRGSGDMKAGLAVSLFTAALLAAERETLQGELVLALVGDEETGGQWGTRYLLENSPLASGDAMLSADAGSPSVIRFGEKGQLWIEVTARGIANHGAHVHLGRSAIDTLLIALSKIASLRDIPTRLDHDILASMLEARQVSEITSGKGEFETLGSITVNIGKIRGGDSINIIADEADALVDIRVPPGTSTNEVESRIVGFLDGLPDVSFRVLTRCESYVTDPESEIVKLTLSNANDLLGGVVKNIRVGMSDARLYRERGIPSVVYGPTPHNMGGADEFVDEEEIFSVFYVHAMTAYDYLLRK